MKDSLIEKMSRDLNIKKNNLEKDSEFYARLIYSALSEWLKVFTLDKVNEDDSELKSKHYLTARGKRLLMSFLELFPECNNYFFPDTQTNPLEIIRNNMLCSGDLIEVDDKIGLPIKSDYKVVDNVIKVYGLSGEKLKSFGISKCKIGCTDKELPVLKMNSVEMVSDLYKFAKWQKVEDLSDYEIFNFKMKQAVSKCWVKDFHLKEDYFSLCRIKTYGTKYFLLKLEYGKFYVAHLNKVLEDFGEWRRIIHVLRYVNNNQIKAYVKLLKPYVELQVTSKLPKHEENILMTFCWPKRDIEDRFCFLVPLEVWGIIKEQLEYLAIKIENR